MEQLNAAFEKWEALSDLEVCRILFNLTTAAPADQRLGVLSAMPHQIGDSIMANALIDSWV
jgi:hypothetical protein